MDEPSTPTDSSQTHLAMTILLQKIHRQSKRKAKALISEEEEEKREKMATKIGMMDGAYFVGRSEILACINLTLHPNLSKVEEAYSFLLLLFACSGAVQCQLMDSFHPRMVPMHKINFNVKNFKHIEVSKLVKDRPFDNLEFMQWVKRYSDSVNEGGLLKTIWMNFS
ncbi:hypothetical protein GQ457_05G013890 [Hibiscus cannabinus]